jgi:hypothetical protein
MLKSKIKASQNRTARSRNNQINKIDSNNSVQLINKQQQPSIASSVTISSVTSTVSGSPNHIHISTAPSSNNSTKIKQHSFRNNDNDDDEKMKKKRYSFIDKKEPLIIYQSSQLGNNNFSKKLNYSKSLKNLETMSSDK